MSEQGVGGYRCQTCGIIFNSLEELDTHTRKVIRRRQTNYDNKDEDELYCGYFF